MKFIILKQLFQNMQRNKFFTFLNLFGISFAVAIIMIIAIKLDNKVSAKTPEDNLERTLIFWGGVYNFGENGMSSSRISLSFLQKMFKKIENAELKTAFTDFNWLVINKNSQLNLKAIYADPNFWKIHNYNFLSGRAFSQNEFDKKDKVIVISERMKEIYFGSKKAIGEYVEYNNNNYKVVGVIEDVNSLCEFAYGEAFLPYSLTKDEIFENQYLGDYKGLILAKDKKDFQKIKKASQNYIANINKTLPKGEKLSIIGPISSLEKNNIDWSKGYKNKEKSRILFDYFWKILLILFIPAISLISLNITRIQERAEEIAVRKAFGASRFKLLRQLFFENIVLTIIGGFLGLLFAIIVVNIMSDELFYEWGDTNQTNPIVQINYTIFFITMGISLIFSLMSGLIPALKMSKLQPVTILKGGEL